MSFVIRRLPGTLLLATVLIGAACSDTAAAGRIDDLESRIDDLQTQLADSGREIEGLRASVSDLEDEVTALKSDLQDAQMTADNAYACAEDLAGTLNGLTIDDIAYGAIYVSCP